ncbi:transposase [Fusobacterium necrophorum]|uniref:Transposase n=1 Tax=Fusobacterium necrophorum TaxID=859 RepID=A0AAW6WFQ7_9FUSO|nr:transposase [Fusobacterium necrophorum]MDK4482055.1 transposase [Fusobacterium necrophorum]MDK4513053.1 transposase [Fusobacterium necrophorum]
MSSLAKSKWETHVKDKLILVEGWARDGLTDEQIAKNLGIGIRTLYEYKEKYPQFSQSLKKGKEVIDIEVENALLRRALGYRYTETAKEKKIINGKEHIAVKETTKEVVPDVTAQIFWLKNRRANKWKDKNVIEHEGEINVNPLQGLTTEELKKLIQG